VVAGGLGVAEWFVYQSGKGGRNNQNISYIRYARFHALFVGVLCQLWRFIGVLKNFRGELIGDAGLKGGGAPHAG
jgi:hypothetical protein